MRTLRTLFGLFGILTSIILIGMFALVYVDFFIAISGGEPFALTVTPANFLMPPFLFIGGIVAIAGRRHKIATIVAGVFFLIAGIMGVYFGSANLPDPEQIAITFGVIDLIGAAFFILTGIFQRGMRMKSAVEKRLAAQYQQSQMQAAVHPVIPTQMVQPAAPAPAPGWVCACSANNEKDAKFCKACGKQNPATETWACECGQANPKSAKFCTACGKAKPETPKPEEPKPVV